MKTLGYFLFILSLINSSYASLDEHLRKIENKGPTHQIKNIDFIYLINLDKRSEKLQKCLQQCALYGFTPHRFAAIYGWSLSAQALNEIGMRFVPGMEGDQWVVNFPHNDSNKSEYDFLGEASYGKIYFSGWMSMGAIGCTLSHLSILQDAYDAGYQTIWVMEDDILIKENPHRIAALIDQLDLLVGQEGWDLLYTDNDEFNSDTDLTCHLWWMWRPDMQPKEHARFAKRDKISPDFAKIGSRTRTHSMIIRRSGMKKILDYEKKHGIFLPYDHELAFAPDIQLYTLRYPLVTFSESCSDTKGNNL